MSNLHRRARIAAPSWPPKRTLLPPDSLLAPQMEGDRFFETFFSLHAHVTAHRPVNFFMLTPATVRLLCPAPRWIAFNRVKEGAVFWSLLSYQIVCIRPSFTCTCARLILFTRRRNRASEHCKKIPAIIASVALEANRASTLPRIKNNNPRGFGEFHRALTGSDTSPCSSSRFS